MKISSREKGFDISICGDLDYEDLIADVFYDGEQVALLTQEEGFANLKITIFFHHNKKEWDFRFDEFEAAIQHAKKRLWELRKIE